MTAAQAMYSTAGFVEAPPFEGSEVENTGLEPLTVFMHLDLAAEA